MESMKRVLGDRRALARRIQVLEDEVQECRQMNVRMAELCDLVTELLLPVADRDEAAVRALVTRYRNDIGDPLAPTDA